PTMRNSDNLVREGYPENFVHVVGNSVVDAIHQKRKEKSEQSIFDLYPQIEKGEWIRMDIHRRENLTHRRFASIIGGLVELIKNTDKKVILVMLNATVAALKQYNLDPKLQNLAKEHPDKFLMKPLWKEYANVIEFLENGDANFYPWLHQRLGLWIEGQGLDYM